MTYDETKAKVIQFLANTDLHKQLPMQLILNPTIQNPRRREQALDWATKPYRFFEILEIMTKRAGFERAPDFYNAAEISPQVYSNLQDSDHQVSRKTALKCIVALKLDYLDASLLMGIGGYNFDWADKKDLIFIYCIMHNIFDWYTIKLLLHEIADYNLS
jgi:hypothetical protein